MDILINIIIIITHLCISLSQYKIPCLSLSQSGPILFPLYPQGLNYQSTTPSTLHNAKHNFAISPSFRLYHQQQENQNISISSKIHN